MSFYLIWIMLMMNDFCIQNTVENTGAKSRLFFCLFFKQVFVAHSDAEYNLLQLNRKSKSLKPDHLLN